MTVHGRHIDTGEFVRLTLAGGRIAAIEPGDGAAAISGPDVWISPGFIDLQLNGYAGANFSHAAESAGEDPYGPILAAAARSGTALFCPTIVTGSRERMKADLRALARAIDTDGRLSRVVAGVHVEGPYLSSEDGPRGAHPAEWVRDPDWEEFQRFQEAAGGRIRLLTRAPERQGP